jgi:hypothetical protein
LIINIECNIFFLRKALQSGTSLSVFPGGSAEMLESKPGTDVVVVRQHKGFCQLAIENGCSIVPIYGFGVTDLYEQVRILCCITFLHYA